jgi:tetratricopeptide (TPR) repeat protein
MNWKHITDIAGLIVLSALAIWGMWRWLKRAEDPVNLIFRWALSAVLLLLFVWKVVPLAMGAPFIGVPVVAGCGLVFAIIWRQELTGILAKPAGSLYDGGSAQVEPTPFYSTAQTHRNRGRYREAVAEVRKQLERFPTDITGQMLLAEIQVQNLNDLQGAEFTVSKLIAQEGHSPRNIAYALNTLADWHLKFAQDRELARQDLERIVAMFPDSEVSAMAAQRIAHLAEPQHILAPHDRKKVVVEAGIENLGLLSPAQHPKAPEVDLVKQASDYVKHLAEHPLDTEAREKLAVIYADHFGRLDMATDQLEQLIAHSNQPPKRVVHWLNLLADLQAKHGCAYEMVRDTLQRIIDTFPKSAVAEITSNRIAHLRLELKGNQKSHTVQLGSYEQDVGLKRGLPNKL